ncbi:MAG: hypothetical protein WBA46_00950 [Thermomicrobiales bacterium]
MRPRHAISLIALGLAAMFALVASLDEDAKAHLDPYLVLFVGLTFTICMLITLAFTPRWTLRSAGILLTLAGDGVLYTAAGGRALFGGSPEVIHLAVDLARSCFYLGAPLLLIGLGQWAWDRWGPPDDPFDAAITHG